MGRRSNLTVLKVPNKSSKSQTSPEGWNLCPRLCQQFSWSNNVPASVISGSLNHQGTKDRITTQFCNRVYKYRIQVPVHWFSCKEEAPKGQWLLYYWVAGWNEAVHFLKSHFSVVVVLLLKTLQRSQRLFNEKVKMRHCVIAIQLWSVQVADHWLVKSIDWLYKQSTITYLFVTPLMIQKKG